MITGGHMEQITDQTSCTGCTACIAVCEHNAIKMEYNENGFWYPAINHNKCLGCKKCVNCCPVNNNIINSNIEQLVLASYLKNNSIRKDSSSGGMFTTLAKDVLEESGVVFGASFNSKFLVAHTGIEDFKLINLLQGSKYVQSYIGNNFRKVKRYLEDGRRVLFSGTPCQVVGLKNYLRKDYDNLICIDLICYGVPSPQIWKLYLKQEHKNCEINEINFKDKTKGWNTPCIKIEKNNKTYIKEWAKDIYCSNLNLFLRPSCNKCKFKGLNRKSDITLGDCWGVNNVSIKNDGLGVSTVIINTEKGKKIWNKVRAEVISKEVHINNVKKYNPMYENSVPDTKARKMFFKYNKFLKLKYAVKLAKIFKSR